MPCYINSATPQPPLVQVVEALGWSRYFRQVLGGGEADDKRLNLEAIAHAEGLGLGRATQLVHVGDGDNDCRAAAAFGCRFVGVVPGRTDAAALGKRKLDATSGPFSGPTCGVVNDMVEAGEMLAELLDVKLNLRLPGVTVRPILAQDIGQDAGQHAGHRDVAMPEQGQELRPPGRGGPGWGDLRAPQ